MTRPPAMRPGLDRPVTRRRWLPRILPILLFVPLLTGAFGAPQTAKGDDLQDALAQQKALSAKIAAQRAQMSRLAAMQVGLDFQLGQTRQALASYSAQLTVLKSRVADLTTVVNQVKATYADDVAAMAELDQQIATTQAQEQAKANDLEQRKAALANRVIAAYRTDQTSLLETILSAQSFADVLSDVSYYMDMSAEDKALASQIVHDQQVLAAYHQTLDSARQATDAMRRQAAADKAKLDKQMAVLKAAQQKYSQLQAAAAQQLAAQRSASIKLSHNKKALAAAIAENGKAMNALKKLIDKLVAAQFANGNIPSVYNGTFQWPMGGSISQPFGCTGVPQEPPLGSCSHFHQGIDLVAPYGTPVRAAGAGVVVFVGYNPYDAPPQAWIVIIAHSQNLQTWYAHMQPSAPSGIYRGAVVSPGQIVGYEGSTGHSTGAHLHWAVELNGSFANPRMFV